MPQVRIIPLLHPIAGRNHPRSLHRRAAPNHLPQALGRQGEAGTSLPAPGCHRAPAQHEVLR